MKLWKIRHLHLDKALLFPRNQAIYLKNWKLWRAPTTIEFNIFYWIFAHFSYLTVSTKGCSRFFLNIWFLENDRALSKFLFGILHYLISIIKL